MIKVNEIPKDQMNSMGKLLIKVMNKFYESTENQQKFEKWHLETYGVLPQEASYMGKERVVSI